MAGASKRRQKAERQKKASEKPEEVQNQPPDTERDAGGADTEVTTPAPQEESIASGVSEKRETVSEEAVDTTLTEPTTPPSYSYDGPAGPLGSPSRGQGARSPQQRPGTPAGSGRPLSPTGPGSPTSSRMAASPRPSGAGPVPLASGPSASDMSQPGNPVDLSTINRRLELPPSAYNWLNNVSTELPKRPRVTNTAGKEIPVRVNSWPIVQFPQKTVFQYDVLVGSGAERRALIRKVWGSKKMKNILSGPSWIFDGNKIAWSLEDKRADLNVIVDLDEEQGIQPREGRENRHRVTMRQTNRIDISSIASFLAGKVSFNNNVLEAINFLDHLLRESPSKNQDMVALKQSFFHHAQEHTNLDTHIEGFKGIYQTIRMCQGGRLSVNVDINNGCFWQELPLTVAAVGLTECSSIIELGHRCKPHPENKYDPRSKIVNSEVFKDLRRMHKLGVYFNHRGLKNGKKAYVIDHFLPEDAKQYKFDVKSKETGQTQRLSMYDYFMSKYDIKIEHWHLPVVATTKKGVCLPMDLLRVQEKQRWPYRLNPKQTSNMIKFAVTKPQKRLQDIEFGRNQLNWQGDPYLKGYGMGIAPNMLETKARLLQPPGVQFGNTVVTPGTSGRWDLKGKKFLQPNTIPLHSWGVCIFKTTSKLPGAKTVAKANVENFIREFIKVYQSHGGVVTTRDPPIIIGPADAAQGVNDAFQQVGTKFNKRPQFLMFILPDRTTFHYSRVKKSADCRFGVPSQCIQADHVYKMNGQYMSNVCMKLNAKMGGTTTRIAGRNPTWGHFGGPSLIIGADVSHGAPLSEQPSMAAVTCSWDRFASKYVAACETNGYRVEMITKANIQGMVMPLIKDWIKMNGGTPPAHIYYFRDGVSEGQYQHVLQQEIADIKSALREKYPNWKPKFIVIVASKRHHIRFFPKQGDNNGNPLPGTLVEKDVTHPFEHDFYLCSHRAIQGTARPVHYHVLSDEIGISCNQLHAMIYEHCYQYVRSTTPVSLHPAVYYAHLASNRARPHENIPASSGPHSGPEKKKKPTHNVESLAHTEVPQLLPMPDNGSIERTMWFV